MGKAARRPAAASSPGATISTIRWVLAARASTPSATLLPVTTAIASRTTVASFAAGRNGWRTGPRGGRYPRGGRCLAHVNCPILPVRGEGIGGATMVDIAELVDS